MPLKAVQRRFTGTQDVRLILVGVDEAYSTATVQAGIEGLMRERRNITGSKTDDFNIFDTKQISDTLTGTTTLLTSIVTAVAAISLLVGGIGIMNIMLVSVTERTREIGIRLAIGAVAREVLLQFLVEAIALSLPRRADRPGRRADRDPGAGAGDAGELDLRAADQHGRLRHLGGDRGGVRLFPGAPGRVAQPDRRAPPRMRKSSPCRAWGGS